MPRYVFFDLLKPGMKTRCKSSCVITSTIKTRIAPKLMFREINDGLIPNIDGDIGVNRPIIANVIKKLITINGTESIMVEKRLFGSCSTVHCSVISCECLSELDSDILDVILMGISPFFTFTEYAI